MKPRFHPFFNPNFPQSFYSSRCLIFAGLISLFVLCVFRPADTVSIERKKMLFRYEIQSCFLAFLAVAAFFISDAEGQGMS